MLPDVVSALKGDITDFVQKYGKEAPKLMDDLEKKGASHAERMSKVMAAGMVAGGAAVTAAGAILLEQSKGLEQGEASLQAAVEQTGHAYDGTYKSAVERAIKTNETLGHGQADTLEALAKLTSGFKDPQKALEEMGRAEELAAKNHVSLTEAAAKLVALHGGAAKIAKEFGINMKDQALLIHEAEVATKAHEQAQAAQAKATQNLTDLEARLGVQHQASTVSTAGIASATTAAAKARENLAMLEQRLAGVHQVTLAQQQQLQLAHEAVTAAEGRVTTASDAHTAALARSHVAHGLSVSQSQQLAKAQEAVQFAGEKLAATHDAVTKAETAAAGASKNAEAQVNKQLDTYKGAERQSETFSGQLLAMKTRIEDAAGSVGKVLGPAMITAGPIMTGTGMLMQSGIIDMAGKAGGKIVDLAGTVGGGAMKIGGSLASIAGNAVTSGARFASEMAKTALSTAIETGKIVAQGAAQAATWVAQRAAQAAATIASGAGMALGWGLSMATMVATTIAANATMILATGGIILVIALVVAAVVLLATHWKQVFDTVKKVAGDVWNFLKPIFGFIVDVAMVPIRTELALLQKAFELVFGAVKTVVGDVWNFLKPIFDAVGKGIGAISGAVGAVAGVGGKVLGALPHFDSGGIVGGPVGAPQLAVVHGGEVIHNPARGGGMGGSISVGAIHISGAQDPRATAIAVREELLRMKRSMGSLGLA